MTPEERMYYEKPDIKHEALKTWAPQNEGQYLGGMVILVVGALVGLYMYFNYKSKSPVNEKYAELDKRTSLNEQKVNALESNIILQMAGLHDRLKGIENAILKSKT